MAHVILFTDISPLPPFKNFEWIPNSYSYAAGAFKLASHLRCQGLNCLVVPNCLSFSFHGVKSIIENNKKDLLWVGVSTTFLTTKLGSIDLYRRDWHQSEEPVLSQNALFDVYQKLDLPMQLVWGDDEMNRIAAWLRDNFALPLLIGGAWVSTINKGNLHHLNDNCHIITGNAEDFVKDFTLARIADKDTPVPFVNNNTQYDSNEFKQSRMVWCDTDLVEPDMWLPLEVSRGCAFNCAYCEYDHKSTSDFYKDPTTLRQELIENYEKYGITKYMLVDDLYNDSKDKIRKLYDQCWSRLPFRPEWISYMRLDMFWADPESADIIKASGARVGAFGIETLHDRAGKKVGKGLGRDRIMETLHMLNSSWGNEVLIHGLFIAGLPYEPLDSIMDTMSWTMQTDLMYSHGWAPMWITPPSHFAMIHKTNEISTENDKFAIQWLSDSNWINSEGVTFEQCNKLVGDYYRELVARPRVNWRSYPEIRSAGFSHDDVTNFENLCDLPSRLSVGRQIILDKLQSRINKIIKITD